ncbi:BglG family transcription antiterminator [Virgibacillus necropolis]|uniref:Uncharacterized protein n=1 Tax=Virgibacillus necropolis TaxID=163877 RepID=A0A221M9L4_9BACI|nr:BglG family transcription antiterminator [Virgibacillus necropolis]ASN04319.1 hypothetical protein CFK40_04490 [Virgibacillus necropolis]
MKLKEREMKILEFLLKQGDFVNYKVISNKLNLSSRQVRYDLENLNETLIKSDFNVVKRHHKKGVLIIKKDKLREELEQFKKYTTKTKYKFSRENIQRFILLKLLLNDSPVQVSELQDILFVSRTTVLNHLNDLEGLLFLENLKLEHKQRKGFYVEGGKINKYNLLSQTLINIINVRELYSFILDNDKVFSKEAEIIFFSLLDIEYVHQALLECQKIEKYLDKILNDRMFVLLLTIIMKIIERDNNWFFDTERFENNSFLSEQEKLIQSLLQSSKNELTEQMNEFVDSIMEEVGSSFHIDFFKNGEFVSQLKHHIEMMFNRNKQSVIVKNPVFDQFIADHKELFLATKKACNNAENLLGINIDEQEISFIAIYFASELKKKESEKLRKAKILVICAEGIAISKMIMVQMEKIFEYKKIDTASVHEFNEEKLKEYDLIVTTVEIPDISSAKIVKINNYLQRKDIETLQQFLSLKFMVNDKKNLDKFNLLMKTIRENTSSINNLSKLELDLISILSREETNKVNNTLPKIKFGEEHITINKGKLRWDEGIKLGTSALIDRTYVTPNYENKITHNIRKYGPYMVVAPGVMIAHAGMEDGVIEESMWLTILPYGIRLNDRFDEPITVIFTLAFKNKGTRHLMEKIANLALNKEKMNHIIELSSSEEIYDFVSASIYN